MLLAPECATGTTAIVCCCPPSSLWRRYAPQPRMPGSPSWLFTNTVAARQAATAAATSAATAAATTHRRRCSPASSSCAHAPAGGSRTRNGLQPHPHHLCSVWRAPPGTRGAWPCRERRGALRHCGARYRHSQLRVQLGGAASHAASRLVRRWRATKMLAPLGVLRWSQPPRSSGEEASATLRGQVWRLALVARSTKGVLGCRSRRCARRSNAARNPPCAS